MAKRDQPFKHVCFTINNYTEEDAPLLDDWEYLVFGREVGETGTKHMQAYGSLKVKKRLSSISKLLPRAHIEPMRGTPKQASDYCKKDGDFFEHGELPLSGGQALKRNYELAWEAAKRGDLDSIPADLRIRHYSTLKRIKQDHMVALPCEDTTTGVWVYGISGSGKSNYAREHYPDYYLKAANKWWDGYQGEDNVILEDFDPAHHVLGHHLKLWADKWDFIAEMKGGSMRIRPKVFVVTSQYKISEIWNDVETISALTRRFKYIHIANYFPGN